MNEFPVLPKLKQHKEYREALLERSVRIALGFIERREKLPFPGIRQDSYAKLQQEDKELAEFARFGGYAFYTIDEIIAKFEGQGVQIYIGKNNKDIYIAPIGSRDNKSDTLPLKHLEFNNNMHPKFKRLIQLARMLNDTK